MYQEALRNQIKLQNLKIPNLILNHNVTISVITITSMMPNKFVFQTKMKQNHENLNFLSCSIVLNIVWKRPMVSQCIVTQYFFFTWNARAHRAGHRTFWYSAIQKQYS